MTKIEVKYILPTRWPRPLLLSVGYSGVIKLLFVIASCVSVCVYVGGGGGRGTCLILVLLCILFCPF